MRVLQVVHGWFPRHAGGTERYVAGLVRALVAAGDRVEILAGSDQARERTAIHSETWEGVPLHRLYRNGLYLESWYHAYHPGAEAEIRELLDRLRPELIHLHHWKRLTSNFVEIAAECGIPVVVTLHDAMVTDPGTHRVRRGSYSDHALSPENCRDWCERFWFQDDEEVDAAVEAYRESFARELTRAAEIIVPSRALGDVVAREYPEIGDRLRRIEHGTIASRPSKPRRASGGDEIERIATWGLQSPMKGTHILVEAVARMRNRDRVLVEIWGDFDAGATRFERALRERAAELPIEFHGAYDPEDLPLDRIDCAVFPSVARESHGFTADEAWMAGIPTIVPDTGAPAERLAGRGTSFRAEDVADLARVLDRAVDEGGRALRPRRWTEPRAMDDHAEEIRAVYREQVRDAGRRRRDGAREPRRGDPQTGRSALHLDPQAGLIALRLDRRDRRLYDLRGDADAHSNRLDELETALSEREAAIAEKERVLATFNKQLVSLTALIRERDERIAELDRGLQEAAATRREMEAAFDAERGERDRSVRDRDETITTLQGRLGRRDASIEQIQGIRRDEEAARSRAEAEATELRARIAALEAEERERAPRLIAETRESLRAELAAEQESLFGRMTEANAEVERQRAENRTLQELNADLEAQLGTAQAELASERAELGTLREELQRLRSESRSLEERGRRERLRSEEAERERDDLAERTRRLERLNENLGFKRLQETSSLGVHQEALASALAEIEALSGSLSAVEGESSRLRDELRTRLLPIAAELGVPEDADASAIIDGVVSRHDGLHQLIGERDAIIRDLAGEMDRREGSVSAKDDVVSTPRRGVGSRVGRLARRLRPRDPERLRILVVVHDFLPKHAAGTEIYTYKLLKELQPRHDVQLLFCEARHEQPRYTVSRGEFDGLPYVEVVHNYQWESFEETYRDPQMDAIFTTVLDDFEPDLVHIQHLHYFSMNFVPLAKARGLPIVYTLHEYMLLCARGGQLIREDLEICDRPVATKCADCIRHWNLEDDYGIPNERRALERARAALPEERREAFDRVTGPLAAMPLGDQGRRLYAEAITRRLDFIRDRIRGVDLFISPSGFLRQKFIDCGMIAPDRIIHSDNGFDLTPFDGVERVPSDKLRFGFVGTIAEYKGVHLMLEAFAGLDAPEAELHIWGDLETFQEYKERLLAIPRDERVHLNGRFRNDRIAEVLATIDVLIVPSLWFENSPLTIHEAWMAGIPVVASDRGGMAELVEDGVNGLHFRLGDADDLRAKLQRLAGDPELRARLAERPGVVKPIADNAREIEGYYRRLVAGERVEGPSA